MGSAAVYKIVAIGPGRTVECQRVGAPNDGWMVQWAMVKKMQFVTRYWPSRKGWLLIDCRKALTIGVRGGFTQIVGFNRLDERVFPSENAAVMFAMSILGYQPPTR